MNINRIIIKMILSPLEVIRVEDIKDRYRSSIVVLVSSIILCSIIMPVVYYSYFKGKYQLTLDFGNMAVTLFISFITIVAACSTFVIFSKIFKKEVYYKEIVSFWGLSYLVNIICMLLYMFVQLFNGLLYGNIFAGFIINTVFIMLLVWKAILYFIEMSIIIKLNAVQLLISTLIISMIFLFLMFLGAVNGIQVPMI